MECTALQVRLGNAIALPRQLECPLKLFTQVAEGQQKMVNEDPQKQQFREGLAEPSTAWHRTARKGDESTSQETFAKALAQLDVVLESDPREHATSCDTALIKARLHRYDKRVSIVEPPVEDRSRCSHQLRGRLRLLATVNAR